MNENTDQLLTQEQLAGKYQWNNFPEVIRPRLFEHYTRFSHQGNLRLAEMDIQSVSDTLFWVVQGMPLNRFLAEHERYFGEESTKDLISIAGELKQIRDKANAQEQAETWNRVSQPTRDGLE